MFRGTIFDAAEWIFESKHYKKEKKKENKHTSEGCWKALACGDKHNFCLLTASMRTLWAFKTRTILYLYISERGESSDSFIDGVTRIDNIPDKHLPSCWTWIDEILICCPHFRQKRLRNVDKQITNKLCSKQKQANEQICQETFIRSIKMRERTELATASILSNN